MVKDLQAALRQCTHCAGNQRKHERAPYTLMETPNQPWQPVGADLMGILPATTEGYHYILALVDHHTGFTEAIPLPDKRATTVWQAMRNTFTRYQFPMELITDNGQEFISNEIRERYAAYGIKHLRATALHPQTNGVSERFIHMIKDTIRKLSNNRPESWADVLPEALWAYRVAPQPARAGLSPHQALFGQVPGTANAG